MCSSYLPEISEFCIGFKFNLYNPETKSFSTLVIEEFSDLFNLPNNLSLEENLLNNFIDVDILNREHLENLGWKCDSSTSVRYTKGEYILFYNDTLLDIYKISKLFKNITYKEYLFQGTIKNEFEFKRLIKILNV
jgi:hypothetical protein